MPCYIMYLRQVVHLYSSSLPSELKAALPWLQRSPVQKRTNLGELPTCSEIQLEGEEGEYGGRGAGCKVQASAGEIRKIRTVAD